MDIYSLNTKTRRHLVFMYNLSGQFSKLYKLMRERSTKVNKTMGAVVHRSLELKVLGS